MRHDSLLFALLGTLFFFCSLYLLAALGSLYNAEDTIRLSITGLHFAAAAAGGLLLLPFYRPTLPALPEQPGHPGLSGLEALGRFFPLPLLLCLAYLAAAFCLPSGPALLPWSTVPAAFMLGLLCPLVVCAFFRSTSPQRQGLTLGLCITGGKFLWVALLPLLNLSGLPEPTRITELTELAELAEWTSLAPLAETPSPAQTGHQAEVFRYLHRMLGVTILGLGICLSLFLRQARQAHSSCSWPSAAAQRFTPLQGNRRLPQTRRRAMACFLAVGAIFMVLLGLEGGLFLFRLGQHPAELGGPHWLLLLFLPLLGALADNGERRRRLRRLSGIMLFVASLALALAILYGPDLGGGPLGWPGAICSGVQMLLLILAARLISESRYFPLLIAAIYTIILMTLPSGLLSGYLVDSATGTSGAGWSGWGFAGLGLLLLASLAICLWRGLNMLEKLAPTAAQEELALTPQTARAQAFEQTQAFHQAQAAELSGLNGLSELGELGELVKPGERNEPGAQDIPNKPGEPAGTANSETGENAARLLAFSAAFSLTRRETEIMAYITRGLPLEEIARELGVRASTIRFHQTGLLKKTAQPSRRKLHSYYRNWSKS